MPASEFNEFYLAEQLMAFGEVRQDIRHGILASLIANIHMFRRHDPFLPKDFIIPDPQPPRQQTPEEMLGIMLHLQAVQNESLKSADV